jgi:hypothetical protein
MGILMKIILLNSRGVASPSKKLALKTLVETSHPHIILLQETLGGGDDIVSMLESLLNKYIFIGMDAKGISEGLDIGWNTISGWILNSQGFQSGLSVEVFYEDIGMYFSILNIYGPYVKWVILWDSLIKKYFL